MDVTKKIIIFLFLLMLTGCVTTPVREEVFLKGPTYNIENIPYVPIGSVLNAYGLESEWDSVARKLTLRQDNKEVILCVGSNVAIINGEPKYLIGPVKMRHSIIVIPKEFASSDLAEVYIRQYPVIKPRREIAPITPAGYRIDKIVIDAGHGGKDPGAIGEFDIMEKDITLDIARRVKRYLEDSGIDVLLTRSEDRFISLWKRSDIANKEDVNFFVSIHANANRSKNVTGFEVYYLSEAIDDNARAVAASENTSLKYEDSSFGNRKPSSNLEATLWDIENTESRVESIELAKCITESAYNHLNTQSRGIKAARFYVLKGAKMPSVLIEVGFISNRQEAKRLNNSKYRDELAEAIANGIINYKREYEKQEGFTR